MELAVQREAATEVDVITVVPMDDDILWQRSGRAEYALVVIPDLSLTEGESFHLTLFRRSRKHGRISVHCTDDRGASVTWTTNTVGSAKRQAEAYLRHRFQAHALAAGLSPTAYIERLLAAGGALSTG